jgi:hypothetical protein
MQLRVQLIQEALDSLDPDFSVEKVPSPSGGEGEHIYVRHVANPEWRERVWDYQTPEEVAASLRARQLEVAPTYEELAETSREERLRVRQQATEQLALLARLNRRAVRLTTSTTSLDVALVDRVRAVAQGTSRERRPSARRSTRSASRAGPDDPPSEPPDLSLTPLQRALLHLRAAIEVARSGGPRTLATFVEIASLAFARALTGEKPR